MWIPRSVIRRRLARLNRRPTDEGEGDRVAADAATPNNEPDLGFAASLTGVLILVLGLLWVLSHAGAATLETYRHFLTHRFCYPAGVTHVLLWSPTCLGLALRWISLATRDVAQSPSARLRSPRTCRHRCRS